ncbi:putative phage abortive infection protein [Aquimarina macrocephali]|uniref:putative phage abortive infection protein n=1 Tax=Aquimarina macrocephali TaxID=666563 RepID=UPI000467C5FF|nr:putative phage abortive infection protein [Aquimarina macrocephali]
MKDNTLKIWIWVLGTLSFLLILFSFFAPWSLLQPNILPKTDFSQGGELGKTIGGLMAPFIAIGAAFLTFIAFLVQYQANQRIQKQFNIQQVSNHFFEMLRLHKENVNEMMIVGYDYKVEKTKVITRDVPFERITEKRKVFVTMNTELISTYEICKFYLERFDITNENLIAKIAYRIFYFGIKSEVTYDKNLIENDKYELLKKEIIKIREKHKETNSKHNQFQVNNRKVDVYIKYKPFSGHENRLGHYYRHLYSTVRYIVSKEKDGVIDNDQTMAYLKLLRAQMSNDEQLALYYNYRIGFGANWDLLGSRGNKFLTDYKMLHNLPLERVEITEKAEDHFKEYIKKSGSSLFEWLDERI